ncbi:MAG: hypothetical protein AB7U97_05840 [Pirellulales bacterium]
MITSFSSIEAAIGGKRRRASHQRGNFLTARKRGTPAEDLCCRPDIGSTGYGDLTDPRKITG